MNIEHMGPERANRAAERKGMGIAMMSALALGAMSLVEFFIGPPDMLLQIMGLPLGACFGAGLALWGTKSAFLYSIFQRAAFAGAYLLVAGILMFGLLISVGVISP